VQCHLSGLFVAAPLLAAVVLQPMLYARPLVYEHDTVADQRRRGRREAGRSLAIVAAVLLALQVPFVIARFTEPATPAGPASLIAGLLNPQVFRPMVAFDAVTGITGNLVWPAPENFRFALPSVAAALLVALVYRRDLVVIAVTGGAIAMATVLFTTSTRNYDGYWFVTLTTALTLTFGMAVAAIPSKTAVTWIGVAILAVVAWRQPARIEDSKRFFKYPQYETMVRGSRQLMLRAPVVRDITTDFEVHPTMDRHFIYTILGGRIDRSAISTAIIGKDGSVRLATD
jgi:hypothetical protein